MNKVELLEDIDDIAKMIILFGSYSHGKPPNRICVAGHYITPMNYDLIPN
jgi:hypothetical protein